MGRLARRSSENGHDGGWRLLLVAMANCEADDRSIGSASLLAAVPGLLACLPLSNGGGSVGRGAVQGGGAGVCLGGHARLRRRAADAGVGARGPSERWSAGMVQGFQLPQGRGCSPGPRTWGARRGRAVTCARGGPPAVAWRRPTAIFVRGATARAQPETLVTPRSTLRHVTAVELHAALRDLATYNAMRARRNHAMPCASCSLRHAMPCAPNALRALFDLCET